jgi:hypothetical protein
LDGEISSTHLTREEIFHQDGCPLAKETDDAILETPGGCKNTQL